MPVFAIPALAVAGAALMALLIILGGKALGKFLSAVIPTDLPIIGDRLHSLVEGAIDAAVAYMSSVLAHIVAPVAKLISYPVRALGHLFDNLIALGRDLYHTARWITTTLVPRAIGTAQHYADVKIGIARAALSAAVMAARVYAHDLIVKVRNELAAAINATRVWAAARLATLTVALATGLREARTFTLERVAGLKAWTSALVATTTATIMAAVNRVETFAHAAYEDTLARIGKASVEAEQFAQAAAIGATAEAIHLVDVDVLGGLSATWDGVIDGVDGAIDAAGGAFDDVLGELHKLSRVVPGDLAAAMALTGAVSLALTRYLERCGIPNCRNLSQYGRDLQALLGLVNDAAIIALITGLIEAPEATAREIDDVMSPIADGVISGARHLFGVG